MVEVKPVPRPSLESMGTGHVHTESIIAGGPHALIASNKNARLLAEQCGEVFGENTISDWTFETVWLQNLRETTRGRARAEYAMRWRPMFLAVVSLTHGITLGCRAAGVAENTVLGQREADVDFDAQVLAAQAYCIQLLHSVTMRDAIEGVLEPIFWQGIEVGHVRKVDNRLRVEMLRAHMPQTFKTPGSKVNVNTGNQLILGGSGTLADRSVIEQLMGMRQESLRRIDAKRVVGTDQTIPVPPTT